LAKFRLFSADSVEKLISKFADGATGFIFVSSQNFLHDVIFRSRLSPTWGHVMKWFGALISIALPFNVLAAEFPLEALPPHITLDLPHGERPDWAPTGSDSYIFVDAPGGKPFEKNRITGEVHSILPPGCEGCRVWRAYY
jgi:hypothetical protein